MTRTNSIAKVAAVVAMLGLVAMSFALVAPKAHAATMFTMDMTVGSTGAEVTALQTWLIAGGYSIPAGATGYFGAQTQAALAAYQAANGISPAAGYFGPITRAKVNAGESTTGGSTGGSSTGGLSGGEASLEDFQLDSEEGSGDEGEEEVEIATAQFDVEDGDARIERLEVDFQAEAGGSESIKPWDYFDNVSVWADGKKLDDMDVDSRSDWDDDNDDSDHNGSGNDYYRLTFTGLDYVVREGEQAEITIAADIAGTIDSDDLTQVFNVSVMDDGIRATDSEDIQQYTGDDSEVVDFSFDEEATGDLQIKTNSDDPDEATLISDEDRKSEDYTVFVFDIDNREDVDTTITDLTIDVATTTGGTLLTMVQDATLSFGGEEERGRIHSDGTITFEDIDFDINGDDRETFELTVTLKKNAPDGTLQFSIDENGVEAEDVDSGDDADVGGSATGSTHTVTMTGIMVEGVSKDSSVNNDGDVGTFELTFTVEALEDDVYIYDGADDDNFTASTTGVNYNIFRSGVEQSATTTDSALLQSDADKSGNYWLVEEGNTEEFTLTVTLSPDGTTTAALYYVELDQIRFDDAVGTGGNRTAYTVPDRSEFETTAESVK